MDESKSTRVEGQRKSVPLESWHVSELVNALGEVGIVARDMKRLLDRLADVEFELRTMGEAMRKLSKSLDNVSMEGGEKA